MEQDEPVVNFVEIIQIGRHLHLYPDVTVYYKSETRKFKVEGGCKVKVEYKNDYRRVWIIAADGKHKSVVTRSKREGYQVSDGYWITGPKKIYINFWRLQADDEIATMSTDVDELGSS